MMMLIGFQNEKEFIKNELKKKTVLYDYGLSDTQIEEIEKDGIFDRTTVEILSCKKIYKALRARKIKSGEAIDLMREVGFPNIAFDTLRKKIFMKLR